MCQVQSDYCLGSGFNLQDFSLIIMSCKKKERCVPTLLFKWLWPLPCICTQEGSSGRSQGEVWCTPTWLQGPKPPYPALRIWTKQCHSPSLFNPRPNLRAKLQREQHGLCKLLTINQILKWKKLHWLQNPLFFSRQIWEGASSKLVFSSLSV